MTPTAVSPAATATVAAPAIILALTVVPVAPGAPRIVLRRIETR